MYPNIYRQPPTSTQHPQTLTKHPTSTNIDQPATAGGPLAALVTKARVADAGVVLQGAEQHTGGVGLGGAADRGRFAGMSRGTAEV